MTTTGDWNDYESMTHVIDVPAMQVTYSRLEKTLFEFDYSGIVTSMSASVTAKDQGFGSHCSGFVIEVKSGDRLLLRKQVRAQRTTGYSVYNTQVNVTEATYIAPGDSLVMWIYGSYPACTMMVSGGSVTLEAGKVIEYEAMQHVIPVPRQSLTHSRRVTSLFTFDYYGVLRELRATISAKDQNFGSHCSGYDVQVKRGMQVLLTERVRVNIRNGRYNEYKTVLTPRPTIKIYSGDELTVHIYASYPACLIDIEKGSIELDAGKQTPQPTTTTATATTI